MKTVLTVGFEIPGGFGEFVRINSKASLMDADFVVFLPTLGDYQFSGEDYMGKPLLSDHSSFLAQENMSHWRRELNDFLGAGKTVFIIMSDLEQVYVKTGERKYSGTGRNRQTTDMVTLLSNYALLPFSPEIVQSRGTSMSLSSDSVLKEYWHQFGQASEYRVYMESSDAFRSLVITQHGNRVVGGLLRCKSGGALMALPWIDMHRDDFYAEKEDERDNVEWIWTAEAIEWGGKYFATLDSLNEAIKGGAGKTPTPQWLNDQKFMTKQEIALSEEFLQIQSEISHLEGKREQVRQQMASAGSLKGLLYEQGHALESAIFEAMKLMDFVAKPFRDSDSEFDVVLECPEGRCIGEVEGRDNKPINIDKMRQLEVNIYEDLAREEVSQPAKGILFGNAYRLSPPQDRSSEHFTTKCRKAAERNGTALIRTCDLFEVAKILADRPDAEFAASCRKAILNTVGEIVAFPVPKTPGKAP